MKFLTFLNSGCIDICKNMLISAEIVGINMDDFYIACLDLNAYENLKEYKNAFLHIDQPITEYQDWTFDKESGFRNIVKIKWSLIKKIYQENKNLCWVDTDIVFVENPIELIEGNEEVLFQSDSPGSTLCSGFMVFNDTKECEDIVNECGLISNADDQLVINEISLKKYSIIYKIRKYRIIILFIMNLEFRFFIIMFSIGFINRIIFLISSENWTS